MKTTKTVSGSIDELMWFGGLLREKKFPEVKLQLPRTPGRADKANQVVF